MRIGYIRCSTVEQNEARQVKMMEAQQAERLFIDKASGKNTNRAAFQEMMDYVRAGDVVITESISRIARNTRDLLSIIADLTARQVEFISLKESIDTTTPQGRFAVLRIPRFDKMRKPGMISRAEHKETAQGRQPLDGA